MRALTYTKDGVIPTKSPADPIFIIAPSLGAAAVADRQKFAERHLNETAHTIIDEVTSTSPVTIDGWEGFETVAEGRNQKTDTPLTIYQVILFDDESYIAVKGRVGKDLADGYLPEFRNLTKSLKRKAK